MRYLPDGHLCARQEGSEMLSPQEMALDIEAGVISPTKEGKIF